jgi:hypothetical protein
VLSVGGEYASSIVFLVQQAPKGRRALTRALAACAGATGILLGSTVGVGCTASMSEAVLASWDAASLRVRSPGRCRRRHRAPLIETRHDYWHT